MKRSVDADGPGAGAGVDTYFSHEGGQVNLQFDGSAASNLSHRYGWGPLVDQLLADEQVTSLASAGNVLYPLGDHLGTLRDLADRNESTGITTITNHRRYDDYGNLISETSAAVDELFGYTGRAFDDSTGLQNNLFRWYDTDTGRWVGEDPIGFGGKDSNLNRYVKNDPTRLSDPEGLSAVAVGFPWAAGAAAGDGPLPFGDAAGLILLGGALAFDAYAFCQWLNSANTLEARSLQEMNEKVSDALKSYVLHMVKLSTPDGPHSPRYPRHSFCKC